MNDTLETAARQILDHFGSQAAEVIRHRARDLAGRGEWRAQDQALLVLTRLETLMPRGV